LCADGALRRAAHCVTAVANSVVLASSPEMTFTSDNLEPNIVNGTDLYGAMLRVLSKTAKKDVLVGAQP